MFRFLLLAVFIALSFSARAETLSCAKNSRVISSCYQAKGTISVYANLRPYLKIQNSKEEKIIAFTSQEVNAQYFWPEEIQKNLSLDNDIEGNFMVCPFDQEKENQMQTVCIDSVEDMKPIERKN